MGRDCDSKRGIRVAESEGGRWAAEGDLLKIDCGIRLNGYCGDATVAVGVGAAERLPEQRRAVMETAREALRRGIEAVRVDGHAGDSGGQPENIHGIGWLDGTDR